MSTRREAAVRELTAMERAGLIERRRPAIALTDMNRLRRLVDEAAENA